MADAAEKLEVRNRWTGEVQFTAEIICAPDASIGIKVGLAVRWARRSGADLSGADLSGADLSGADLSGADLRGADLRGADLRGADLSDADLSDADLSGAVLSGAPVIPNIHSAVYEAASQPGALNMGSWHCGTAHCRAGWVVTLAGDKGKKFEDKVGTAAAATLIYLASDPNLDRVPNFYATNTDALDDMKRLADLEVAAA